MKTNKHPDQMNANYLYMAKESLSRNISAEQTKKANAFNLKFKSKKQHQRSKL